MIFRYIFNIRQIFASSLKFNIYFLFYFCFDQLYCFFEYILVDFDLHIFWDLCYLPNYAEHLELQQTFYRNDSHLMKSSKDWWLTLRTNINTEKSLRTMTKWHYILTCKSWISKHHMNETKRSNHSSKIYEWRKEKVVLTL